MRINNECARDALKIIEKIPFGETLTITKLQDELNVYSIEDVINTITILNRERFIMVIGRPGYDDDDLFRDNKIKCLTERGYRTLDMIREDRIWNLMKEKVSNFNDLSFFVIASIASKIINDEHNKLFNLDSKSTIDYSRW